jgi:asparagine synthase (glutamine-hydrolysing)
MLDHEFGEFAASLPNDCKVRNGKGKQILIRALAGRLPASLLERPKMGFGVPLAKWLRGPLREMVWDHLTSSAFNSRGMTEPGFVRHLLEEHQSGRRDHETWIWSLLMLEMWFREQSAASVPSR